MMRIPLGSYVRDTVTGFEGATIGFTAYLTGCATYLVQPKTKDGAWVESRWIDDDRLQVMTIEPVKLVQTRPGGDKAAPSR